MDATDHAIIAELRRDARISVSSLAAACGIARATARARLDRLIASGEIAGFTVVLRSDLEAHAVHAVTMIEVEGKASDGVVARLRGLPDVLAIHTTNGRWDLIAEIGAADLAAFDEALRRIRLTEGIAGTETSLLLSTRKGHARGLLHR